MDNIPSLPDYSDVNDALGNMGVEYTAAQAHGLMCGLICTNKKQKQSWQSLIMGEAQNPQTQEILQELYDSTEHQLTEFSFEFSPLLPNDSRNINERAEALGLFCQGFLIGLEKIGIPIKGREPSDVTEAIDDLLNISQVTFGEIAENEEDEGAYFELIEYVRLAVLMLYQEFTLKTPLETNDNNGFLH